jgi:ribosomal protein S18 acetylase RimI-like enzyme
VTIRAATLADVDSIYTLGKHISEFSVNDATVIFWPKSLLSSAVRADDVLILVAEEQGIAGFIIINYNRSLKKALIENIFVKPELRSQGIGDQLLQKALEILVETGCEYITTLVPLDAGNAIKLYMQNGFDRGESFLWLDKSLSDSFKRG